VSNLGSVAGYDSSFAYSINNNGQIVGDSNRPSYNPSFYDFHATLWSKGSTIDLGTLGGTESYAYSINDNGQIVGESQNTGNSAIQAVIWDSNSTSTLKVIGNLGTVAVDNNNYGQVVGLSNYPHVPSFATLWSNGSSVDLGSLGGLANFANSINDAGLVVGFSSRNGISDSYATIWTNTLGLLDLNNLLATSLPGGAHLNGAFDINNVGQILAQTNNGYYVLTPTTVPVPAAVWLFGSGLVGLLSFNCRKNKTVNLITA